MSKKIDQLIADLKRAKADRDELAVALGVQHMKVVLEYGAVDCVARTCYSCAILARLKARIKGGG